MQSTRKIAWVQESNIGIRAYCQQKVQKGSCETEYVCIGLVTEYFETDIFTCASNSRLTRMNMMVTANGIRSAKVRSKIINV